MLGRALDRMLPNPAPARRRFEDSPARKCIEDGPARRPGAHPGGSGLTRIVFALGVAAVFAAPSPALSVESFGTNLLYAPRPNCLTAGAVFAVARSWGLGPYAETCRIRDDSDVLLESGSGGVLSFYRFGGRVFTSGWTLVNVLAVEARQLESEGGSDGSATFARLDAILGYQWVWGFGFNLFAGAGAGYAAEIGRERNISSSDSGNAQDFIRDNTEDSLFFVPLVTFGWAF